MMNTSTGTRRAFVGSALAGAALLVPVALVTPRRLARATREREKGVDSPALAAGREAGHWATAVGRRFRLSANGETVHATLTHVDDAGDVARLAPGGRRPFRLRFASEESRLDGDAIYALDRPVAGMRALFMTRGLDEAGRVVLSAVLA